MSLAAVQFRKLGESEPCVRAGCRAGRECDQNFVCVETRVFALQVIDFQLLDRLDRLGRNDMEPMIQSCQLF